MSDTANAAITAAPAPWACRATVYSAVFWVSASQAADPGFSAAAYAPLERDAPFGREGAPEGGLATVMLVRYQDTPVGTYDEMMLLPGKFGFEVDRAGRRVRERKLRITRIYVSQRNTTWNGRTSELSQRAAGAAAAKTDSQTGTSPSTSRASTSRSTSTAQQTARCSRSLSPATRPPSSAASSPCATSPPCR